MLLHRLNDAQDQYHIIGGRARDATREDPARPASAARTRARHERVLRRGWRRWHRVAQAPAAPASIFSHEHQHLDSKSIRVESTLRNSRAVRYPHDRAFSTRTTARWSSSLGQGLRHTRFYSIRGSCGRPGPAAGAYENQQRDDRQDGEFSKSFRYKNTKSKPACRSRSSSGEDRAMRSGGVLRAHIKFPRTASGTDVAGVARRACRSVVEHVFGRRRDLVIAKGATRWLRRPATAGKTTSPQIDRGHAAP